MRLDLVKYSYIVFAGLIALMVGCDIQKEDALTEQAHFVHKEFEVTKNGSVSIPVDQIVEATLGSVSVRINEGPRFGSLAAINAEYLKYAPETNYIGNDFATLTVRSATDSSKVLRVDTLKFVIKNIDNQIAETPNRICDELPITDGWTEKHLFITAGDTLVFNMFNDVLCVENFANENGEFISNLISQKTAYGEAYLVGKNSIRYINPNPTGSGIDKVEYELTSTLWENPSPIKTIAYIHISDICSRGYQPLLDLYTLKVSQGTTLTLDLFQNDKFCGLTINEIKARIKSISTFGTIDIPLDQDGTVQVGSFDISTMRYTTNVTTQYFDENPGAYVRGNILIEFDESVQTRRVLAQVKIIR